jgi:hypothetical protein
MSATVVVENKGPSTVVANSEEIAPGGKLEFNVIGGSGIRVTEQQPAPPERDGE